MGEKETITAALLHDIGKFGKRAGRSGKHPEISKSIIESVALPEGVDRGLVGELVARHHDRRNYPSHLKVSNLPKGSSTRLLARIVSEADNLSSAMDREGDEEVLTETPLISVLSEVEMEKKNRPAYLKPERFEPGNLFPEDDLSHHDLVKKHGELWSNFQDECKLLPTSSFKSWYISMVSLLKKYTSTIVSASYRAVPDIPLYDHLKTTASIAQSLYKKWEENPDVSINLERSKDNNMFLFIEGNLSGIQNFIFRVHNAQKAAKSTAKRLRGRSFYLTLLSDAICRKIQDVLDLPSTSLLWDVGGKFLLIAPNTYTEDSLIELKRDMNLWIHDNLADDIVLDLYWAPASPRQITNFGKFREQVLGPAAEREKLQRYASILSSEKFEPVGKNVPEGMHCPVCGGKSIGEESCERCKAYEALGAKLVSADYILVGKNLDGHSKLLDYGYSLVSLENLNDYLLGVGETVEEIIALNTSDFFLEGAEGLNKAFSFRFLGKNVPKRGSNTISFDEVAQFSQGPAKLGILKADVDSLGKILSKGLQKGDKQPISKIHSFATLLDTFFTGYLSRLSESYKVYDPLCEDCRDKEGVVAQKVETHSSEERLESYYIYRVDDPGVLCIECSKKAISTPYITYSGGDDLLVVAPYDHIIELASKLREEFQKFSGGNPNLTLSAGIAITSNKFPFSKGVSIADELLESSKTHAYHFTQEPPKDSVSLFGETVLWDSDDYPGNGVKGFKQIFDLAKKLEKDVNSGKISKSLVYSLLDMWNVTFSDVHHENIEKVRLSKKKYVPLLKYNLARNVPPEKLSYYEEEIKPLVPWTKIPVAWVSYRTRER